MHLYFHSSVTGRLAISSLALVSRAGMNTNACVCAAGQKSLGLCSGAAGSHGRGLCGCLVGFYLLFGYFFVLALEKSPGLFQSGCLSFHFHRQCVRAPVSVFVVTGILVDRHSDWGEMESFNLKTILLAFQRHPHPGQANFKV